MRYSLRAIAGAITISLLGIAPATQAASNSANFDVSIQVNATCAISASNMTCLLYTSPSPRDLSTSRMPSSA